MIGAVSAPASLIDPYTVGTLRYTRRSLIQLFSWLLWGDFCFQLMETIVPSILPLKLKSLGAPNWVMALIISTLPGMLNMTVCPWISYKSDRHRGLHGRRIPYILKSLPFLAMFLLLLAFSDKIGGLIHKLLPHSSAAGLTVICIGVFVVGFQFCNMFVNSVFWYLFNDVVPPLFLGRFMGLFRLVFGIKAMLYSFFVYQYAETYMMQIFVGTTALYSIGFGLMCLMVREGDYPPVEEEPVRGNILLAQLKTYTRECYRSRFYWDFFLSNTCNGIVLVSATYQVFLCKSLGLTLEKIGIIGGLVNIVNLLVSYPAGIVADRIHPLRMVLWLRLLGVLLMPLMLVWLIFNFSSGKAFWILLAISTITVPITAAAEAMTVPMFMRVLPQDRYGQFCSANAVVRSLGLIIGGLMLGAILDWLQRYYGGSDFAYRYLPVWDVSWMATSLYFTMRVAKVQFGSFKAAITISRPTRSNIEAVEFRYNDQPRLLIEKHTAAELNGILSNDKNSSTPGAIQIPMVN